MSAHGSHHTTPAHGGAAQGSDPAAAHGHHAEHHEVGHLVSVKLLVTVLAALLFLTGLTVWTAEFDLGFLNIWVAMGIAGLKASLVVLFFMHLLWDRPFNKVVFVGTLIFFSIFISFCLMDTREYAPQLDLGNGSITQQKIDDARAQQAKVNPAVEKPSGH